MSTVNLNCHDYLVVISFFACIAGLWLLSDRFCHDTPSKLSDRATGSAKRDRDNELEETEQTLLRMTFAYWLLYCVAVSVLKLGLPEDWQIVQSLKLTGIFSFFLTFSCLVSLPLHKVSIRRIED
jgi:hypothetical protein